MKIKNVSLIIYDFDGVFTDNRVLIFEDGKEAVLVDRSDGLAVQEIKKMKIPQIIVSTETNPTVRVRARKLGINLIHSVKNKKAAVRDYIRKNMIKKESVIFVGNDINDKEAMEFVGWPIAPANAHEDIKKISKLVLRSRGGFGAIRELLDVLIDHRRS